MVMAMTVVVVVVVVMFMLVIVLLLLRSDKLVCESIGTGFRAREANGNTLDALY